MAGGVRQYGMISLWDSRGYKYAKDLGQFGGCGMDNKAVGAVLVDRGQTGALGLDQRQAWHRMPTSLGAHNPSMLKILGSQHTWCLFSRPLYSAVRISHSGP